MCGALKSEFKRKKLSLNLKDSKVLNKSWILPSWVLLMLRSAMALFCVVITIVSVVGTQSAKWCIYLTIWSYVLLTVSFVGLTFLSFMNVKEMRQNSRRESSVRCSNVIVCLNKEDGSNLPTSDATAEAGYSENQDNISEQQRPYVKFIWLLWIASSACALLVSLLYWTLVFKPPTSFIDISLHALNTIFVIAELFMGTIPVHLLHGLHVMALASIYVVFTVIYWAAGGRNLWGKPYIYKPLDYENGHPAFVVATVLISIFVVIPLVQLLLFVLYQLRCYLRRKIYCGSEECPEDVYIMQ